MDKSSINSSIRVVHGLIPYWHLIGPRAQNTSSINIIAVPAPKIDSPKANSAVKMMAPSVDFG